MKEHCHQCQGSGTVGARREIRVNIPPSKQATASRTRFVVVVDLVWELKIESITANLLFYLFWALYYFGN